MARSFKNLKISSTYYLYFIILYIDKGKPFIFSIPKNFTSDIKPTVMSIEEHGNLSPKQNIDSMDFLFILIPIISWTITLLMFRLLI